MIDKEISLTAEDVKKGVNQVTILESKAQSTKFGMRTMLRVKDNKGTKWLLWCSFKEETLLARYERDNGSVDGMKLNLSTETYVNKEGQSKERIILSLAQ